MGGPPTLVVGNSIPKLFEFARVFTLDFPLKDGGLGEKDEGIL
jgi:hypothetical protein